VLKVLPGALGRAPGLARHLAASISSALHVRKIYTQQLDDKQSAQYSWVPVLYYLKC
jgi:hypothetical protein